MTLEQLIDRIPEDKRYYKLVFYDPTNKGLYESDFQINYIHAICDTTNTIYLC